MVYENWTDEDLLEEILDMESGLTEWETTFVVSLEDWFRKHDALTAKQRAVLERILRRRDEA